MIEFNDNHAAKMAAKWLNSGATAIKLAKDMPALPTDLMRLQRAGSLQTCLAAMKGCGDWFAAPDLAYLQSYIDGWLTKDENCRDVDQISDFCAELHGEMVAVDEALRCYEDAQDDWGMQRVRRIVP